MNVGLAHDQVPLQVFLTTRHPHIAVGVWQGRMQDGRLSIDGRVVRNWDHHVRAGMRVVHTIAQEIEPDVSVDVTFIYEDNALAVLSKPAPLAVHPCGRYNRNSLMPLLGRIFADQSWHLVHRLDADTTGLMVLAKNPVAARHLGLQFERRTVQKTYLARVFGVPKTSSFSCDLPVTDGPGNKGRRSTDNAENAAFTAFEQLESFGNQSLVTARPRSGRTNQIRVHLAALGLPIVGDNAYGGGDEFTSGRSALCLHAWKLAFRHPEDERFLQFCDEDPPFAQAGGGAVSSHDLPTT